MQIVEMNKNADIDQGRAERIKHVRKKLFGLKAQDQFAEVLANHSGKSFTRGAVGNWELGKHIALDSLTTIADAAGISLDWLAYGAGEKPLSLGARGQVFEATDQAARVPLVGYVRAGDTAAFYAISNDPLDWVAPIGDMNKNTVAVQIQGESLGELFDTWLIYYDEVRSPITPDLERFSIN